MNKDANDLISFITSYSNENPGTTKQQISNAAQKQFLLENTRSVYHSIGVAIRFSSAAGRSFSNGVLSLSALKKYDHIPFIVCVVRREGVKLLMANSTFLKKISHSSHKLRIDNIRGTFLGHDIMRDYEGTINSPENFGVLFEIHLTYSWADNLRRLVKSTKLIKPTGKKYIPTKKEKDFIIAAPKISAFLSTHPEYHNLYNMLDNLVEDNFELIIEASKIDNVNIRGNKIEQIITQAGNLHKLEDLSIQLAIGPEVKIDIKTKILTLSSSPKGYNIDKALKALSIGNTVISFFFVGINIEKDFISTCLISIFDKKILRTTRVQYHWSGRNSRGVTQLSGDLSFLFSKDFRENIDVEKAQKLLQVMLDL